MSVMAKLLWLSLSIGSVLWAASAPAADTWPQYRGANRDGISTEQLNFDANPPTIAWRAKLGTGYTSMAIASGRVYASGNTDDHDTLFCLDIKNGKTIWKHTYPQPLTNNLYEGGPNATPTIVDNRVYILAKDGYTACLDAQSGKVVWEKNIAKETGAKKPQWGFSGSPTVLNNVLYVNVGVHGTAVDAATGKVLWKSGGDDCGYASIMPFSAGKETHLLVFGGTALHGVDATSGKELWNFPWETKYGVNAADPIIAGTRIFLSSGYNYGCGLIDIATGKPLEVWRNKEMRNHFNASVLLKSHLYGFDENTLKCIEWKTGKVAWSQDGLGKGSLAVCSDALVILSEMGELVIADAKPDGFTERSRSQVLSGQKVWASPAIAEGMIFVRNPKGDLVALSAKK